MTRKQNAIMDRKYSKVVVKTNYDYISRLDRAIDLATKIRMTPPSVREHAMHLMGKGI